MLVYLSSQYNQGSTRDPKVFLDSNGLFHMLVTTSIRRGDDWQGCLAHLTSTNLVDWIEQEPALLTEVYSKDFGQTFKIEPECSDYFYKNGWYYLVGRSQYWMSRKPFGTWQQPDDCQIPCGSVPKMAFWQKDRIIFTGFTPQNGFGGCMIFKEAIQQDDGTLKFIPVKEMQLN